MSTEATVRAEQGASVALRSLMHTAAETIDPKRHPTEAFDCYSAAAFGAGHPEVMQGNALGARMQLVEASDILLSRIIAHPRRAWVVGAQRGRRQLAAGDWLVLRSASHDPGYLRHLLTSNAFHLRFMRAVAAHGKSARARPDQLGPIEVPSPVLAEQRRIAQVLDAANTLRVKRQALFAALDQLAQALFHDLFGDAALDVPGLAQESIAATSVAAPMSGPALPRCEQGAWLQLRARSIRGQSLDLGQVRRVELPGGAEHALADGDLLLARSADAQTARGEGIVVYPGLERWTFDPTLIRLRFDRDRAEPEFILHYVRSAGGRALLAGAVRGPKARSRIDPGVLATLAVPLPPIESQRELTRRLAALGPLHASARRSAATLDALLGSLRDQAFTGELRLA